MGGIRSSSSWLAQRIPTAGARTLAPATTDGEGADADLAVDLAVELAPRSQADASVHEGLAPGTFLPGAAVARTPIGPGPLADALRPSLPPRLSARLPAARRPESSVAERVFLAADTLEERLTRLLPAERNGGQFGALVLIGRGRQRSPAECDALIERLASAKRHEDWLGLTEEGHFALILSNLGYRDEWAARRAAQFTLRLVRGPCSRESRFGPSAVGATLLVPVDSSREGETATNPPIPGSLLAEAVVAAQREARFALRQATDANDGEVRFFHPTIDRMLRALGTMDRDLRAAVDHGGFVVQLQPIVDSQGGLERAEALVRWRHANGTLIPADRFFDRAESLGLAVPIGYQVIDMVVRQLAFWARHQRMAKVPMAVNISASQLADRHLIEKLGTLLETFKVPPGRLVLELAEPVIALASSDSLNRLQELHQLGCRLAVDGFGRGWLTWSRIRELPLRELKLPISSPAGIGQATRLAGFARQQGLTVTATRIETREQWRDATKAPFQAFQGHLIGRPAASTGVLMAQLDNPNIDRPQPSPIH